MAHMFDRCGDPTQQKGSWQTLPPSSIGFGNYDNSTLGATYSADYLMPIALLGHITFWTDLTRSPPPTRPRRPGG